MTAAPRNLRHAFTLLELLAAIAIIAVLAAMIAPAVISSIKKAQQTVCLQNLRTIGSCLLLSTNDNGCFPVGTAIGADNKNTNWYNTVALYLPGDAAASSKSLTKLFYCPSVEKQFLMASVPNPKSYSANPIVMPDGGSTGVVTGVPVSVIRRPSQTILVMDGPTISGNGNAAIVLSPLSQLPGLNSRSQSETIVSINAYSTDPQMPRFRHGLAATVSTPGLLNAAFADGSVQEIQYGDLKYKNLTIAY